MWNWNMISLFWLVSFCNDWEHVSFFAIWKSIRWSNWHIGKWSKEYASNTYSFICNISRLHGAFFIFYCSTCSSISAHWYVHFFLGKLFIFYHALNTFALFMMNVTFSRMAYFSESLSSHNFINIYFGMQRWYWFGSFLFLSSLTKSLIYSGV